MTYIGVVLTLLLIVNIACIATTLSLNSDTIKEKRTQKNEEIVEKAMSEREKREATLVDEGFDNIMRYQVNGMSGFDINE